jgi:hypothetical protein
MALPGVVNVAPLTLKGRGNWSTNALYVHLSRVIEDGDKATIAALQGIRRRCVQKAGLFDRGWLWQASPFRV